MKDVYKVLENFASDALLDKDEYIKMYNESINNSEVFWKKHGYFRCGKKSKTICLFYFFL